MPDLTRAELSEFAAKSNLKVAGVTSASSFERERTYIRDHMRRGHTRGMDWFTEDRADQSAQPLTLHPSVRSIVSVGVPFWSGCREPPDDGVLRGRIARYAWGRDYHKTLRRRMQDLVKRITDGLGRPVESRTLADTARAFDRAIAARSGAGWFGKNSMIIVPGHGSWVMLGAIYLDLDIPSDLPLARNCGRCTMCLDRCPTQAIVEPYRIDAPRCISYLTIEERGAIPREIRPKMGAWVFGCDICQDVCPYTAAAEEIDDCDFAPATIDNAFPSLEVLATMTHDKYVSLFAGTAVTRAKRRGLARNAAIALGNSGDSRAEPILLDMIRNHDEPLARSHATWALSQLCGPDAAPVLDRIASRDPDDSVRKEARTSLGYLARR